MDLFLNSLELMPPLLHLEDIYCYPMEKATLLCGKRPLTGTIQAEKQNLEEDGSKEEN